VPVWAKTKAIEISPPQAFWPKMAKELICELKDIII